MKTESTTPTEVDATEALLKHAAEVLITGKPKATKDDKKAVEATDPIAANELLALRESVTSQIKDLTAVKNAIDAIIKDTIGNNDVFTIHGAVVASMSRWRETQLNKEFITENFAVADYPEMFTRVSKTRLDVKK